MKNAGIGDLAVNLMGSVGFISDFIYTGCFVVGGSFVFAALIKYFEYRRNPYETTLGRVFFIFLTGILLLILPFSHYFISHAPHYSLIRR